MGLQTLAGATFATALLGAGTVVSANVLTVQQGDTLSEIAQKHHTTVATLRTLILSPLVKNLMFMITRTTR